MIDLEYFKKFHRWLKKIVTGRDTQYIVFVSQRCRDLAYFCNNTFQDDPVPVDFILTAAELLDKANILADYYLERKAFPHICVINDVSYYGGTVGWLPEKLFEQICACLTKSKVQITDEVQESFYQSMYMEVFTIYNTAQAIRYYYQLHMSYVNSVDIAGLREHQAAIVRALKMANPEADDSGPEGRSLKIRIYGKAVDFVSSEARNAINSATGKHVDFLEQANLSGFTIQDLSRNEMDALVELRSHGEIEFDPPDANGNVRIRFTDLTLAIVPRLLERYYSDVYRIGRFFWSHDKFPQVLEQSLIELCCPDDTDYVNLAVHFAKLIQTHKTIFGHMLEWDRYMKLLR